MLGKVQLGAEPRSRVSSPDLMRAAMSFATRMYRRSESLPPGAARLRLLAAQRRRPAPSGQPMTARTLDEMAEQIDQRDAQVAKLADD